MVVFVGIRRSAFHLVVSGLDLSRHEYWRSGSVQSLSAEHMCSVKGLVTPNHRAGGCKMLSENGRLAVSS